MTKESKDYEVWVNDIPVVGISYRMEDLQELDAKTAIGLDFSLRREPDNKFDSNAIAVDVTWTDSSKPEWPKKTVQVGYLPREFAAKIVEFDLFELIRAGGYRVTWDTDGVLSSVRLSIEREAG